MTCRFWLQLSPIILNSSLGQNKDLALKQVRFKKSKIFTSDHFFYVKMGTIWDNNINRLFRLNLNQKPNLFRVNGQFSLWSVLTKQNWEIFQKIEMVSWRTYQNAPNCLKTTVKMIECPIFCWIMGDNCKFLKNNDNVVMSHSYNCL